MVDVADLKSAGAIRAGSSPVTGTTLHRVAQLLLWRVKTTMDDQGHTWAQVNGKVVESCLESNSCGVMRGSALWRDHLYFNEGGHVIRTLRFIVDGNVISPDPSCDFSGLFPGKDEIRAEFIFSKDWSRTVKVAGFFSIMGREYEPQIITDDACMIPADALKYSALKIKIFGKKGHFKIETNELIVYLGGKK